MTDMRPCIQRPISQLKPSVGALILGVAASWTGLTHATESSAAAAAVAKLLALPVPGSEAATAAPDKSGRAAVTVLRGETLDRVIRRTLPGQPFKDEFLRKAFVQLNPGLLDNRTARVLPAGSTLTVPSPQDLLAMLSQQYPTLFKARPSEAADEAVAPAPKRRWVQFP
jgi:Tfp pilus assembly protein FimV